MSDKKALATSQVSDSGKSTGVAPQSEPSTAGPKIGVNLSRCLQITNTSDGSTGIHNRCKEPINYAFCGLDANLQETVGVCGKDIGGNLIKPHDTDGLTQGRASVHYYYFGCAEYFKPDVRWTGRNLVGKCIHL